MVLLTVQGPPPGTSMNSIEMAGEMQTGGITYLTPLEKKRMNEKLNEAMKWIDLVLSWNASGQMEREAVMTALCNAKTEIRAAKLCLGPPQPPKTEEHPVA